MEIDEQGWTEDIMLGVVVFVLIVSAVVLAGLGGF